MQNTGFGRLQEKEYFMRNLTNLLGFMIIILMIGLTIISCDEPLNSFIGNENEVSTGTISGKVIFFNSDNHTGITITLEKTDGLRSISVIETNRSIASGASRNISSSRSIINQTQTTSDGSFILQNIPEGTYVLYASSQNSLEKAVTKNVTVTANQEFNTGTLNLTSVGNVSGKITVDGLTTNSWGFLVSVAGTSYMAMTNSNGDFTISGIPSGNHDIIVMKSIYTALYANNVPVTGGNTTTLETKNVISTELSTGSILTIENGNWYINGVDTGVPATGPQGEKGETGNNGNDGVTPHIGANGNWWIGSVDTGIKAQGQQGQAGQDGANGVTPHIGVNGNWWIGTVDTGIKAQGQQGQAGQDGTNGISPHIGTNGNWWIGTTDTGIKAQGQQGQAGQDGTNGISPHIGINGNWWIGTTDTGIKAQGPQGDPGTNGITPYIGSNGHWWIGTTDTGVRAQGQAGQDGTNGISPHIGTNGNWWIGTTDTGIKAQGPQGDTPYIGENGNWWFRKMKTTEQIIIAMWDQYGDGWNGGAALRINVNGNDLPITASLSSGHGPFYFSFVVNTGDLVQLYWISGSQWDYECAYAVYFSSELPEPMFSPFSNSWSPSDDLSGKILAYKQYDDLRNVINGMLIDSFTAIFDTTIILEIDTGVKASWDPNDVKNVYSSGAHTMVIKNDGTLWAWGWNNSGQVGVSPHGDPVLSPVRIGTSSDWETVFIGESSTSTIALRNDGTLWAWGSGMYGVLGNGSGSAYAYPSPFQIGFANNWESVSTISGSTLAIKKDGTLWAWGENSYGQLGDGSTTQRVSPVQIGTDSDWASVEISHTEYSGYSTFTLAIKKDGTLWAWGRNNYGQLGDGSTTDRHSPVQIGSAGNWASVSINCGSTMAIKKDGTLWAWGANSYGQLGDGSTIDKHSPIQIGSAGNWASVSINTGSTMAIKKDGTLWAWGLNNSGQVGDGSTTDRHSPVQIGFASNWASVSINTGSTMAIKKDGTLWGWGANSYGQVGDGSTTNRHSQVQIGTASNWSSISIFKNFSIFGTRKDGTLWAWGNNSYGQLGNGTRTSISTPYQIIIQ